MKANLLTTFVVLLVLTFAVAQGAVRGVPDNGRAIFADRCAGCHGITGGGDGPLAPFLSPRPASLISAGTSVKTDEELLNVISNGKPKTAMPAWKDLLSDIHGILSRHAGAPAQAVRPLTVSVDDSYPA